MADKTKKKLVQNLIQFCTFKLSGRLYGVNILDVKEVNPEVSFTTVHHAPEQVKGFVNIRGRIHLILNLRHILGLPERETGERSRLVLFKHTVGEDFGILVDSIGDVVEIDESLIESGSLVEDLGTRKEQGKEEHHELISGVCRLDDMLLLIINARDLLGSIEAAREKERA